MRLNPDGTLDKTFGQALKFDSATVFENTTDLVYTAKAGDLDGSLNALTYSLGGADKDLFTLDATTGEVRFRTAPDYENPSDAGRDNTYYVTLIASDGDHSSSLGLRVEVKNSAEATPIFASGDTATPAAIDENSGAGQVVYTARASASDAAYQGKGSSGKGITYSLGGTDASLFSIDSATGEVALIANPDYETHSNYAFTVIAKDSAGKQSSQAVTLNVNDLNDVAPVFHTGKVLGKQGAVYGLGIDGDNMVLVSGKTWVNGQSVSTITRLNADGSTDDTFGTSGTTTQAVGSHYFGGQMSLQAAGTILVAGTSDKDFSVMRLLATGELDTRFSDDGMVTTSIGAFDDATAITTYGEKIIVAGISDGAFGVIQLDKDGNLDTGFNEDGKSTVLTEAGLTYASMAVQADGNMVLVGISGSGSKVVRLDANGDLDRSFGSSGILTQNNFSGYSVTLQDNGKILIAGESGDANSFTLLRLQQDGTPDPTFGEGGLLVPAQADGFHMCSSVILDSEGRILMAGTSWGAHSDAYFSLIRLNDDGSLDTSFGNGGSVIQPLGAFDDTPTIRLQNDGKIVLAGTSDQHFGLMRLDADGSLDTTFGDATQSVALDTAFVATDITTDTVVYTAKATDAELLGDLSYSLSGDDAASFNFNTATGELKFKDAQDPANGNMEWHLAITASDGINASNTLDLTIWVKDDIAVTTANNSVL